MPTETVPYGRKTQKPSPVAEVHILWITAGLGCDGDSVSITAATQPSIEDVLLGAIPGLPKVHLHNPVLAYENGDDFLKYWHMAAKGQAGAVRSGGGRLDPEREDQERRLLGGLGNRRCRHGQPIHDLRVDRPAGAESTGDRRRRARARPTAASTRWREIPPAAWAWPIIWDGIGDRRPDLPIVNVPGCPVQPDNFMETLLYLLYQVAGLAPMIPLDDQLRPTWLFGKTVHEGCDRAGYYEQGDFAEDYNSSKCIVKLGCWGPVVNCNVPKRGWMAAWAAAPTSAASASAAPCRDSRINSCRSWTNRRARRVSAGTIGVYGRAIRALRSFTNDTVNKEPKWRHPRH